MSQRSAVAQYLAQKVDFQELATRTMRQDWPVFLFGTLFFFGCQFFARFIMTKFSKNFRSLSEDDKNTWCVRFVASVNSLVCMLAVPIQYEDGVLFTTAHYDADTGYPSLYEPMPWMQRYFFISLCCYFVYDFIVCIYYRWGAAYIIHAVISFTGVYAAAWPFAERYASYMGTCFEATGVWLHGSEMLDMIHGPKSIVMGMKAIFSVMFLLIRPVGGTLHAARLTRQLWIECVDKGFADIHHPFAVFIVLLVTWGLMAMQLYWTKDVLVGVLSAMGLIQDAEFGDVKSPTKRKAGASKNKAGSDSFPAVGPRDSKKEK